jgi:hypothetical protein
VGVVERSQKATLGNKSSSNQRIGSERSRQLLDGNGTAELTVATGEHNPPGPATQLLPYFIGGKG